MDTLIVGAGPAGSTLASLLTTQGVNALVVDRATFPRTKPCGECVNPGAVSLLAELGDLDPILAAAPATIRGWCLTSEHGSLASGDYDPPEHGLGVPRSVLDDTLVGRSRRRGVEVVEGTSVMTFEPLRHGGYDVHCRSSDGSPRTIRCRYLVGADGLRSVVARRLGLMRRRPRIRKLSITCRLRWRGVMAERGVLFLGSGFTVGLAPVHRDGTWWNGTVVLPPGREVRADKLLDVYRAHLRRSLPMDNEPPSIVDGPWTSGPFDWPVQRPVGDDALLIGDAAGYFDPLTGQGIFQALTTARLAADAILRGLRHVSRSHESLAAYALSVKRQFLATRAFQHIVERVVAAPALRTLLLRRLSSSPRYADRLVRYAGDVLPLRGLGRLDLLLHRGTA